MVGAKGWVRLGPHPAIADWAAAARPMAVAALAASGEVRRCGGTWAVGLDLLANDATGRVGGVDFPWQAVGLRAERLHQGQLSAVYPGYPQPGSEETPAAARFRLQRDAAHLDGLLPIGPARARMMKEPHAWILGLPLNDCGAGASPLVVWEGSHAVIRARLAAALQGHPAQDWGDVDLTDAYAAARAEVFATCQRVEVLVVPGEASLLHRLTIHGVAPWKTGAEAPAEGRIIAYFRPLLPSVADWLALP
jgi:hypothetical protein